MSDMFRKVAVCAVSLVSLLFISACAKNAGSPVASGGVQLVQGDERSRHFDPVNSHLELGGALYGYADVDGNMLALAGSAQSIVKQLATVQPQLSMFAKQDFRALMTDLGLDDIKAVGLSLSARRAVPIATVPSFIPPKAGTACFQFSAGNRGNFWASLAPRDVDFFAEHEFDIVAVYRTVRGVIAKVNGPEAADAFEKSTQAGWLRSHFSLLTCSWGSRAVPPSSSAWIPTRTCRCRARNPSGSRWYRH